MGEKLTRFDGTKYMETVEDQIEYFNMALETGDPRVIVNAVGTIARARGMTELAKITGIGRSSLYNALADDANPTIETVMKVLDGLKLELRAQTSVAA